MNSFQRTIKYLAIAFAAFLTVIIITGIVSAVSFVISMTTGDRFFADDEEKIEFTRDFTDVEALEVNHSSGDLIIKVGDGFRVEASNVRASFSAKVTPDGTLTVKDKSSFVFNWFDFGLGNSSITIYLPEDFTAAQAKLNTGAGAVTMDSLKAGKLTINAGAGNIKGSNIMAEEADIDGGVGNITFSDSSFKDVDFDSGVGNLFFEGALHGDCEIDSGVGKVDIELDASREDYGFDIDTGLGTVRIDGDKISKGYRSKGDTDKSIKVDGGVGNVSIDFNK